MGARCAAAVLALAALLLLASPPAAGQPATSDATTTTAPATTRTTLVPGQAAVTPEGSPQNNIGLVVGLVAVGAIVIGAGVLYLRYRGRGNTLR